MTSKLTKEDIEFLRVYLPSVIDLIENFNNELWTEEVCKKFSNLIKKLDD